MSNASYHTAPLHITQLHLAGEGAWPNLNVDRISDQLNVFYAPPRAGKSSVAQLVGHLLYGKSDSPWRRQFAQTVSATEGSLQLGGERGNFTLRRQYDTDRFNGGESKWRLTISSEQGDTVDSQTIHSLLSDLSPELAAKLFYVDFAESPRVGSLLSQNFAREFTNSGLAETPSETSFSQNRRFACCTPEGTQQKQVDRRRVDELILRRDTLVSEIEKQLSVQRRESGLLQRELDDANTALESRRQRAEQLQTELHRLELELAELETSLRYYSLDRYATGRGPSIDVDQQQRELAELDQEISRCRQTLAELQQREGFLRTELAQWGADGTADSVTCLADGRATLGIFEQLLDDLDAEVSQLARASEPGRCIGHDSHAKISPVAALLRQQVYTLCGQLTEQERITRRQQLTAESRQLARVHAELGDRLDLLLSRRESLIQRSQLAGQTTRLIPQPPAVNHCRCEHHGEFIQVDSTKIFGRADRQQYEADLRNQLNRLQQQRTQRINELNALHRDIEQLEQRWENLQRERASLIGGASVEDLRTELARLESIINQAIESPTPQPPFPASYWRASDILAQLTDGHLVQIRLERHRQEATVIDRHGRPHAIESLSPAEHDQLYLALTLSLASSYARRGIRLPLILDEPFLQQNAAQAATMAGVLDEFARAGHQLLIFTEDHGARRRFSTLSATIFELEDLRQTKVAPKAPEPAPKVIQTTNTHIVRKTYDGHSTPSLRLATVPGTAETDDVFYLTEDSTFQDFPVLGADTNIVFNRINIHLIGDLLIADAADIARQLNRKEITAETVQLWQIHMGLMCHVPELTLDDAQVLAAVDIDSPDDFYDADIDRLLQSIEAFLRSDRGSRFARSRSRYTSSRLSGWRSDARRYRDRWQHSSRRYSGWRSRRSSVSRRSSTRTERPQRKERRTNQQRTSSSSNGRAQISRERRFYLSREQDVEAAPSIGPKTAEHLAKTGIRTVADLLHADPESTAAELDKSHISAATIAAWQHQARLVCQIPELRGYGAQLLVACGMTQPEQIATTSENQLVDQILAFCETKEGQRILRSGDAPAREKIAEWVELASHSRPLEAA